MKVFIGTVTTGACLSVISQTKADNMFQITPSASAAKVIAMTTASRFALQTPTRVLLPQTISQARVLLQR